MNNVFLPEVADSQLIVSPKKSWLAERSVLAATGTRAAAAKAMPSAPRLIKRSGSGRRTWLFVAPSSRLHVGRSKRECVWDFSYAGRVRLQTGFAVLFAKAQDRNHSVDGVLNRPCALESVMGFS